MASFTVVYDACVLYPASIRDLDIASHRVAQHIGQVQSSLLRMSGAFQRALNKIESQRVHLGASGLSTSDVIGWLRSLPPSALAQFAHEAISCVPESRLVLGDIALDIAEFELIDRERPERIDVLLPPPEDAPAARHVPDDPEDLTFLVDWLDQLRVAPDNLPLDQAVPARDYALSSYRLSLLTLIGNTDSDLLDGPAAELARLRRTVELTGEGVTVAAHGVAQMRAGRLTLELAHNLDATRAEKLADRARPAELHGVAGEALSNSATGGNRDGT